MPGPMEGIKVVELGFWVAGPSLGLTKAIINQFFGSRLVRAEVVVQGTNGAEDWLIDRSVIKSISGPSISLTEGDGRVVTVIVDQNARHDGVINDLQLAGLQRRLDQVIS